MKKWITAIMLGLLTLSWYTSSQRQRRSQAQQKRSLWSDTHSPSAPLSLSDVSDLLSQNPPPPTKRRPYERSERYTTRPQLREMATGAEASNGSTGQ